MRFLAVSLIAAAGMAWLSQAQAGIPTHNRHVEGRIVEPCGIVVSEGEVVLEWEDFGGDFELITFEYEDYPHPISVLVYAGDPDWSELDAHTYQMFFCGPKYTKRKPDVYCASCDPYSWYYYRIEVDWCGETICILAYLPCCMALEVTDVW